MRAFFYKAEMGQFIYEAKSASRIAYWACLALAIVSFLTQATDSFAENPVSGGASRAAVAPSNGDTLDFSDSSKPIDISAENGIEWHRDAHSYVANGNVIAVQDNITLYADKLSIFSVADGGEIDRALAEGNVKLITTKRTITAHDSLEYWRKQDVMVARGDAKVTEGDKKTHSDRVTAYFKKDASGKRSLFQLVFEGMVQITTQKQTAICNKAVYSVADKIIIMTGDVVITQGENRFSGERAEIDEKNGISRLIGAGGQPSAGGSRVHTLIQPKKKSAPAGGANTVVPQ